MNDEAVLGYTAGIIDGEGSIGMSAGGQARVVITMTDTAAIRLIQGRFGGKIYQHKMREGQQRSQKTLAYGGKAAEAFLKAIRPYLRVKAVLADVMLEFFAGPERDRPKFGRRNGEQEAAAEECYWRLRVLNGSASFGEAKNKVNKDVLGKILNEVRQQVADNEDGEDLKDSAQRLEEFLNLAKKPRQE